MELIPLIFEAFRRLSRLEIGQSQCPVLNLVDSDDHFADSGIRFALRTIFDGGAELLWVGAGRQGKCRLKPKVRSRMIVERVALDGY